MAKTHILPSSAMRSPIHTKSAVTGLNWTQIPGSASQVAAGGDGSIWVLSTEPAGSDKYIWHYTNGSWTNISGLASKLSVAHDGTLFAINSGGGAYAYQNGNWTPLGGGASALTAAADGSLYVMSNGGAGPDQPIWHNVNGNWSQVPGAGTALSGSWDTRNYATGNGPINASGLYILNSLGSIYYENADGSFATLPGNASSIAPTQYGGTFALGYPTNPNGNTIYYYDLDSGGWTAPGGAGVSIAVDRENLYVVGASGAIYTTLVTHTAQPTPPPGLPLAAIERAPNSAWAPYAVANAFQFPVQSGYDGSGMTIAIVIDAVPSMSDVNSYLAAFNIHRSGIITVDPVDGGPNGSNSADEATLDLETIAALSPGANIIVYAMPALNGLAITDAYNQILSEGRANVVSSSFGGCESPYADMQIYNPIFVQGAQQGVAFIASSGDQGNECFNNGSYKVGAVHPASDPNVIGVGGSESSAYASSIVTSTGWNDGNGASGGGVSGVFALPQYQAGLTGVASTGARNIPDIALPGIHDAVYENSSWFVVDGTSWGAPQAAALVAELYEYCNVSGFIDPVTMFYYADAHGGYSDFMDITNGTNQYKSTTPYFSAGPGYDNVSGIGVPLGMPIANTICPNHVPQSLRRAVRSYRVNEAHAPAVARIEQNVSRLDGLSYQRARNNDAPTRLVLELRATPTLASDEAAVVDKLRAAGFTITQRYRNHLVIDAQAPAALVESYFKTTLVDFMESRYGVHYANTRPMTVPGEIAPYVRGLIANDLIAAQPMVH